MSNSAPWQYQQGAQTGTGTGGVKLFNPAEFGSVTSQASNYVNNSDQGGQIQASDQKQADGLNSSWDWNPSQWNSGRNDGHVPDTNQQIHTDQGHNVPSNVDTSVYQGQFYDHNQQAQQHYYNQQQYQDPGQQTQGQEAHGQQNWGHQQYGYNQTWNNTDLNQQHQPINNNYDGQQIFQPNQEHGQPYNVVNQEQVQGHFNLEQGQDHFNNQGFNQEHVFNQQIGENDGLNSSAASNYSGSLTQSSVHEDQGSTSGFYQNADPEDVGFMGQNHSIQEPIVSSGNINPPNVVHSSANDGAQLHMGIMDGEQLEHTTDKSDINTVISQVNHMTIQDNESSSGVHYGIGSVNNAQEQGFGITPPVSSSDPQIDPVQTNSGMMTTSDDQQSLGDWEVVPPQNLVVPGNHSRQSSTDNNVQFFIGSSRNSPGSGRGTGSPCSVTQGQIEDKVNPSLLIPQSSSQPPKPFQSESMMPKYTSSPNITPETTDQTELGKSSSSNTGPPPPMATPTSGRGGDNPFRKTGHQLASSEPQQQVNSIGHDMSENVSSFEGVLSSNENSMEPPSPILNADDQSRTLNNRFGQKMKSQSPIMPRKESPFQPPARRRNVSGSSETIEENTRMEEVSRQDTRDSLTRGIEHSKSLGSDRSSGADSSRRSSGSDSQGQSDRDSIHSQDPHWKTRTNRDRRSRPPPGPGGSSRARAVMSPRRMEKHLQHNQERRVKHNMSPATTLWADSELQLPATNILLAPAGPMPSLMSPVPASQPPKAKDNKETEQVLSPVENLITSLTEHISKENTPEPETVTNSEPVKSDPAHRSQGERKREEVSKERDRHERNSSIDRELEIVRRQEEEENRELQKRQRSDNSHGEHYSVKDQYNDSRGRDPRDYREREPRDPRDSRDRRDDGYDNYYDRRSKYSNKGAPPLRDPYKDQYYGDERYDRPRSRTSQLDDERPSSRQSRAGADSDRPRSRQDYRDPSYKDGRYSSASRGGYDYDYYNHPSYYDSRYYHQGYYHDSRYNSAYYDEYYRQGQGQGQEPGQYNESYDRMMDRHYHPYYGYPSDYYGQGYEDDRYSQRSQSRGAHTPASIPEDQSDGYGYGGRTSSRAGYDDYHRGHYDHYYGYRHSGYHYQDQEVTEEMKPGRITPKKYTIPHMRVCFGPGGQMVKVLPNNPKYGHPATVEIQEVDELLQENMETEELKSFPGPLVRGDTHKNDVLSFCQRKARACAENINMIDRESAELIWKFLELLIKQNGIVMGTDIAELLLDGHEPTTAEYSMIGLKISQSMDNLDQELDDTTEVNASTVSVTDRSVINRGRSREEVTDRFRHLLLYGRKKDALECAMKRNLWGHALFLASKMDSRTHANVMIRFANTAMKMNDPLQTLYQLMSGRQPAAVTSIANDRWGDWRPHLAMILSNQGNKPDLDQKSIMSMGDTLASKGFLHASHFCYMIGRASFGSYYKKTAKLVLIGSNHSLPLEEFTTNEAIQCTEIYEYAMSLGNTSFFLPNFQYFKFLYACTLAENGFPQEALQYFEVISRYIQRAPTFFQPTLVKMVYNMADRLKHSDPQRMHTSEDHDQPWLVQLQKISQCFSDGSIRPLSGNETPIGYGSTRASSGSAEVAGLTHTGSDQVGQSQMDFSYQTGYTQQQGYGDQPDQSQSERDGQSAGQTGHQQYNYSYPQHGQPTQETLHEEQQVPQQYTEQQYQDQQQYSQEQHNLYNSYYQQGYGVPNNAEVQQGDSGNQTLSTDLSNQYQGYTGVSDNGMPQAEGTYVGGSVQDQNSSNQTHTHNTVSHPYDPNTYSQTGETSKRQSMTSDSSLDTEDDVHHEQQTNFDYFGAATNQKIVAPRLRKRTTSETSQGSINKSTYPGENAADDKEKMPPPPAKTDSSKKQGNRLGGWFSKFLPKPKNEMKLPNDDKPSIVWDKDSEKWVNLDKTEEESKPVMEPPKDSDIFKTPAVPATPNMATSSGAPPSSNKFSRPKGRGARTQYVDVMNTSGSSTSSSTVPKSLFNVMPTSASSPAIFNPLGGNDQSDTKTDTQQSVAPPAEQNMNQSLTSGELSRTSSMSSVSYEVQQLTRQDEKPAQAPNMTPGAPPTLFNPSQFKTGQHNVAHASGPKLYNQRRVYPK